MATDTSKHARTNDDRSSPSAALKTKPLGSNGWIEVVGAREHNLQNITVRVPRGRLTVITGVSGSGKSSLAFHTIHAEGQRRYVESLSAYARQFLGGVNKPDVDEIRGLSPAVAIDQKTTSHNPRSTVGTVTEIADYARLLWARVGTPHCPVCGRVIEGQTIDEMVAQIENGLESGTKFLLVAPIVTDRKGEFKDVFERLRGAGFSRAAVDGDQRGLDEDIVLEKQDRHTIELVVDRLVAKPDMGSRLRDSLETGLEWGEGIVYAHHDGGIIQMSRSWACPEHGIGVPEMEPRTFSFNAPVGACERCHGLGFHLQADEDLMVEKPDEPIRSAFDLGVGMSPRSWSAFVKVCAEAAGIGLSKTWNELSESERQRLMHGDGRQLEVRWRGMRGRSRWMTVKNTGLTGELTRRYETSDSAWAQEQFASWMSERPCPDCKGARLKPGVLAVTVGDMDISDWMDMPVEEARPWIDKLELPGIKAEIGQRILTEISNRLRFLDDVGVGYLTLSRRSDSVSGGESQRLRLASVISSSLTGACYVLDEPSIGLAARDNERLLKTLHELRDLGNTVIVVEHDEDTLRSADYLLDLGPGAGEHGGYITAVGTPKQVARSRKSLTGDYIAGRKVIELREPLAAHDDCIRLTGARGNNLTGVDVEIPTGQLVCVTGVSGSGKSTLIVDTLVPAIKRQLTGSGQRPSPFRTLDIPEGIDRIIEIDQKPIGKTPKSNPATYTKVFDHIRQLFAQTSYAKSRGWKPGRFSFNVEGGRCPVCKGEGYIVQEMLMMADVELECETCHGKRYNDDTLQAKWKGHSIADVLNLTVTQALDLFANQPKIRRRLQTLADVGLGYIRLNQPAPHLSGGEAQRCKLAKFLQARTNAGTIVVFDEPSTGLHTHDVATLIDTFERMRDEGSTIIVIEHNLDIIKRADYIVDLGPEGGSRGGQIIGAGTPADIAKMDTPTGVPLRRHVEMTARFMQDQDRQLPEAFSAYGRNDD